MHEPYETRLKRLHDFRVTYRFYSELEGGRKTGTPYQGYRCDFSFENFGTEDFNLYMIWPEFEDESGNVITEDETHVPKEGTARMWIISEGMRPYHKEKIIPGMKGFMMEGHHKTGEYQVIEINGLREP